MGMIECYSDSCPLHVGQTDPEEGPFCSRDSSQGCAMNTAECACSERTKEPCSHDLELLGLRKHNAPVQFETEREFRDIDELASNPVDTHSSDWMPCTACKKNMVHVADGYDTCQECLTNC